MSKLPPSVALVFGALFGFLVCGTHWMLGFGNEAHWSLFFAMFAAMVLGRVAANVRGL
jgi:hypothetical protein